MKTLVLVFFFMPAAILAQWGNPLGILGVEINGNSAILKNDSAWRNCGANYEMVIYQLEGDTLGWYQKGIGLTNCDCLFNLSVTLDSLVPGDYHVKTSFEDSYTGDTIYIGLITFTIQEQNAFLSFVKTDEYQSPCGIVGVEEPELFNHAFTLIPNPANNLITIQSATLINNTMYVIYNSSGLRLREGAIRLSETNIDISVLTPGVYYIKLQNEKMVELIKMVKK
jgi:hypothetical protein